MRFECTQCGNCCKNHGDYTHVYLVEAEVGPMAQHLGLSREAFLERYVRGEDGYLVLRMDDPACPFLGADDRCQVYPVRPRQCATWPFWTENLPQEVWEGPVAECCPGIGRGELTPAAEVERIARETDAWYDES